METLIFFCFRSREDNIFTSPEKTSQNDTIPISKEFILVFIGPQYKKKCYNSFQEIRNSTH